MNSVLESGFGLSGLHGVFDLVHLVEEVVGGALGSCEAGFAGVSEGEDGDVGSFDVAVDELG